LAAHLAQKIICLAAKTNGKESKLNHWKTNAYLKAKRTPFCKNFLQLID